MDKRRETQTWLTEVLSSSHVLIYSLDHLKNFVGGELMKSFPVEYADASPGVQAVYDDVLQTMQGLIYPIGSSIWEAMRKYQQLGEVSLR